MYISADANTDVDMHLENVESGTISISITDKWAAKHADLASEIILDRKGTSLQSSPIQKTRMPSSDLKKKTKLT